MKNFELPNPLFKNVSVKYIDSTQQSLVQFADMVSNSYYLWLSFGRVGTMPKSLQLLNAMLVNHSIFEYPVVN